MNKLRVSFNMRHSEYATAIMKLIADIDGEVRAGLQVSLAGFQASHYLIWKVDDERFIPEVLRHKYVHLWLIVCEHTRVVAQPFRRQGDDEISDANRVICNLRIDLRLSEGKVWPEDGRGGAIQYSADWFVVKLRKCIDAN